MRSFLTVLSFIVILTTIGCKGSKKGCPWDCPDEVDITEENTDNTVNIFFSDGNAVLIGDTNETWHLTAALNLPIGYFGSIKDETGLEVDTVVGDGTTHFFDVVVPAADRVYTYCVTMTALVGAPDPLSFEGYQECITWDTFASVQEELPSDSDSE